VADSDRTLFGLPHDEWRRVMLGASRVEILGEAGYDAVADLKESRGVHRKLLNSDNDLVRFKAVELDHKIHGTLAPQAVYDPTPRFSVSIKLQADPATLHNGHYRQQDEIQQGSQALPGQAARRYSDVVVESVSEYHAWGSAQALEPGRRVTLQESDPTPTPRDRRGRRIARGVPTQPTLARSAEKTPRARRSDPELPRAWNRCSRCHESGHNARTCEKAKA
jgi:hypothetical protein